MYSSQLPINPVIDVTGTPNLVTQKRGFIDYKDYKQIHFKSRLFENKDSLLKKASVNYTQIVENIHPLFQRGLLYIPKRTLTNPREPSKNDGFDNINDDYILRVDDTLGDSKKYEILDLMGQGTFGQVAKCRVRKTKEFVAVKVIKRQPAYLMQGDKEVQILLRLRDRPNKKDKFLQLQDCFTHRGHTCAVFELLSISLHKLFSQQKGRPNLTISDIQKISINILETLSLLKEMGIIHTDLKPDNILMKSIDNIHDVKLIDYGSALLETESLNYCVQTAFYRSPEVILHVAFGCAIDMWSFGCFVAEMYLGVPLFPSGNESTLIRMMVSLLGCLPPGDMLKRGKRSNKFFHLKGDTEPKLRETAHTPHDKTANGTTLSEKILNFRSFDGDDDDSIIDNHEGMLDRERLLDFLSKILVFNPDTRLNPNEALQHPFLTSVTSPVLSESVVQPSTENQSVSPALLYASLSIANTNNSSSINTSRTTEDSPDIRTPPNTHQSINRSQSKESMLLSPDRSPNKSPGKSPEIVISPPQKKVLKSILKKKPSADYQQFIQSQPTQQDNTLDARVAYLYNEPRPHSAVVPLTNVTVPLYDQQPPYTAYVVPLNNPLPNTMPTSNTHNYQQQHAMSFDNSGYHIAQPSNITAQSPQPYYTQRQYNVPQQAPMYPNRHFSPLQQF